MAVNSEGLFGVLFLFVVSTSFLTVSGGTSQHHDGGFNAQVPGKCELYIGNACSEVLNGKHVFIKSWHTQRSLEDQISVGLTTARRAKSVSQRCWPHARELVCFHTFPPCDITNRKPENRSFCHDECRSLESGVCKREFLLARSIHIIRKYIPWCEDLSAPGTEGFQTCRRLQSLNVTIPIPVLGIEHQKNVTARASRKASLKCWFTTAPAVSKDTNEIAVGWFKGGEKIGHTEGRYRVKMKKRRAHKIVSILLIKGVSFSDAGYYRCTVTQGKKAIESGVLLTIQKAVKKKRKKKEKRGKEISDSSSMLGKCIPYEGQVCSKYLSAGQTVKIFEYNYSPQSVVERRLQKEFQLLQRSSMISRRCKEFGLAAICYNMFQACNKPEGGPVPRLCQSDCFSFEKVFCKNEVAMARKQNSFTDIVPDCESLPRTNPFCVAIKINSVSGVHPTTMNPDQDNSVAVYTEDPSTITYETCYTNKGETYLGRIGVSKKGRVCRPWKEISHNYRIDHAYCRNFGGHNFAPWCHVGNGDKEWCDIPKCSIPDTLSNTYTKSQIQIMNKICYYDVGEDYVGLVSKSKSGKQCQSWKLYTPNYEASHSYCRNYGGKDISPWCYVAGGNKEYCDIPKCPRNDRLVSGSETPSLVLYIIVPTAVALSVILLVVLLILVYLKHRKSAKENTFTVQVQKCQDISSLRSKSPACSDQISKGDIEETTFIVSLPLEKSVPEIEESQLHYIEKIGDGSFGQLWKAETLDPDGCTIPLLIKRVKSDASKGLMDDFVNEMNDIAGFRHKNIIELLYISSPGENLFMGFESNDLCSLKLWIRTHRQTDPEVEEESQVIDCSVILDMCIQICTGLEYLHSNEIIHKDLGTRNCLINGDNTVKIAYFGLGPYVYPEDYFIDQTCYSLPVRWMSPEALRKRRFTKANDVWSFSVLLWEMFSSAAMPYADKTDIEAINCIGQGELLPCPKDCPARLYSLMKECWSLEPSERLTFSAILKTFDSWNVQIS